MTVAHFFGTILGIPARECQRCGRNSYEFNLGYDLPDGLTCARCMTLEDREWLMEKWRVLALDYSDQQWTGLVVQRRCPACTEGLAALGVAHRIVSHHFIPNLDAGIPPSHWWSRPRPLKVESREHLMASASYRDDWTPDSLWLWAPTKNEHQLVHELPADSRCLVAHWRSVTTEIEDEQQHADSPFITTTSNSLALC